MALIKPTKQALESKDGSEDRPFIDQEVIMITPAELEDFGKGIVQRTLVEMGYKAHRLQNGRITRKEMIEVLGSRAKYEKAVKLGRLRVHKDGERTSGVWAKREDFEKFLHDHTNKKI